MRNERSRRIIYLPCRLRFQWRAWAASGRQQVCWGTGGRNWGARVGRWVGTQTRSGLGMLETAGRVACTGVGGNPSPGWTSGRSRPHCPYSLKLEAGARTAGGASEARLQGARRESRSQAEARRRLLKPPLGRGLPRPRPLYPSSPPPPARPLRPADSRTRSRGLGVWREAARGRLRAEDQ